MTIILRFLLFALMLPVMACAPTPEPHSVGTTQIPELLIGTVSADSVQKIGLRHRRFVLDLTGKRDLILDIYLSRDVHPTDRTASGEPLYHHIEKITVNIKSQSINMHVPAKRLADYQYIDASTATFVTNNPSAVDSTNYGTRISFAYGAYEQARKCMAQKEDPRTGSLFLYQDTLTIEISPKQQIDLRSKAAC